MQVRLLFHFLAAAVFAAAASGCASDQSASRLDHVAVKASWAEWKANRDTLFLSDSSPLLQETRVDFSGLAYFPYDSLFALSASLVPTLSADTVRFPTTTGELRPMIQAGHLAFRVNGVAFRLAAYQSVDRIALLGPPRLFVPFRDATSGKATYGGGRYLDLDVAPTGQYVIDFNKSYNPYCVYNVSYSCPLPPPENTLGAQISAGEIMPNAASGGSATPE